MKNTNRWYWFIVMLSAVALISFGFTPALADETGGDDYEVEDSSEDVDQSQFFDEESDEASFGLRGQALWVSATQHDSVDSPVAYNRGPGGTGSFRCRVGTGFAWFDGPISLPSGARILTLRVYYDDNSASARIRYWIFRTTVRTENVSGAPSVTNLTPSFPESPAGISRYGQLAQNQNIVIANRYNIYQGRANLDGTGVCIIGARIFWQRQVRTGLPNPFNDIGGLNQRFQNGIKALAASQITSGCGGGSYCPNDPVTRGQMAVFLSDGLGLHWDYFNGNY
jgi:hypothetical protein